MTDFYNIWIKAKFTGIDMKLGYSTIDSLNIVKPEKQYYQITLVTDYTSILKHRNSWKLLLVKMSYVLKLFTSKH